MLFSISNVKAYDFTGYKSFTQIYLHKDSANYEDNTCKFTSSDSHCSLLLRYDSFPYDKLVYKFYANTFNLTKDKEYRFTFFLYSTFDISTFTNNFVFRVGENDYTFTIVEPKHVKLEVERVGSNAYITKVSLNFTSPYNGVPVISLWMYDTSNASIDTYFGAYKYYMIQDAPTYIPSSDEEGFWFNTSSLEAFYSFDNLKRDLETYLVKSFPNLTLNDVDYFCSDGNSYSDSLSITCQVSEKPGVFSITSTQYFGNVVKGNYTFSTVNSKNALINNGNATFSYTSLPSDAYYPQIKANMNYYSTVDIYSDDGTLVFESSEKKEQQFFTFRELDFNPDKTNEIIFDYKIPTGKNTIDFDLDYSIKSDIDTSPNLPIPILKITYESGEEDIIYLEEESNSYIGHYISCLGTDKIITNLQLIIDLKGVAGLVDIEFTSNFDFDVTYTDKVLPTFTYTLSKDETYNYMQVNFTFHNWTDENYKWVISSTETYQNDRVIASINSDMKNCTLYANTTETMYVSLYYKDTALSTEIIEFSDILEDYFTKEEIKDIQKEETFRKEDLESIEGVMNNNKNFIQQLAPITNFFKEIFEHMFETLPSPVRKLLIFMFSISLLVGIAWWLK